MSRFRLAINSTVDVASILNRQLYNTSVLSLGTGNISGFVDVIPLNNIRLFSIKVDQALAIFADRSSENILFSIDIQHSSSSDCLKAQGVSLSRAALFGFNSGLSDMDLLLPASSHMCCVDIPVDLLIKRLKKLNCTYLQEVVDNFNVLVNSVVSGRLLSLLKQCWDSSLPISNEYLEDEIICTLVECLADRSDRKIGRALNRQDRHQAALDVLSTTYLNPTRAFEVQDLSDLLHQSRTSLFNGCKEKFGMSPVQIVRSVRLHQVRYALLDVEFCIENNLNGVIDTAEFFGFIGRSHFTKHYKNEFKETPRQTLSLRRKAEQFF